jgi:hypothetical protein
MNLKCADLTGIPFAAAIANCTAKVPAVQVLAQTSMPGKNIEFIQLFYSAHAPKRNKLCVDIMPIFVELLGQIATNGISDSRGTQKYDAPDLKHECCRKNKITAGMALSGTEIRQRIGARVVTFLFPLLQVIGGDNFKKGGKNPPVHDFSAYFRKYSFQFVPPPQRYSKFCQAGKRDDRIDRHEHMASAGTCRSSAGTGGHFARNIGARPIGPGGNRRTARFRTDAAGHAVGTGAGGTAGRGAGVAVGSAPGFSGRTGAGR